jgi:multidrug efflux pump
LQVLTPPPGLRASDYRSLIVASRGGAQVRLSDVAEVIDSVENTRLRGMFNGKPAIVVTITQEPGANLIKTANAIDELLPQLRAQLPQDIALDVAIDRTGTIRAGVREVQVTLIIAIALVVIVVGLFLRNLRSALIPGVATVVSLLGTFAVMYALDYSLNNLTLMALTVATGFVVDDAIVVLENISRYIEQGQPPYQAALRGAREVGFTVLTISLSLVAVFIPLLFQSGQIGPFFREFAMTLTIAVSISLVISLTTTPMMCAFLLKSTPPPAPRRSLAQRGRAAVGRTLEKAQRALERMYGHALDWSLAAPWTVMAVLLAVVALNVYLFSAIPKGFFPDQDNGQLMGGLRADQSISSSALADKLQQAVDIVYRDPAIATVVGFSSGSGGGFLSAALKPFGPGQRTENTRQVVNRLRPQLRQITGLSVFLNPVQELRSSGRSTNSTYEYTLKTDSQSDLKTWVVRLSTQLKSDQRLTDVDDDQSENGVETYIDVDRDRAAQLGVSVAAMDSALYNAFGQRSVATMYADMNQYSVVMEWAPTYTLSPIMLRDLYVPAGRVGASGSTLDTLAIATGTAAAGASASSAANPGQRGASVGQPLSAQASAMVPLSAFASVKERAVPTMIRHDNGELSSTLSFNLADGVSIEEGRRAVSEAVAAISLPNNVRGEFSGAAAEAQKQQNQQVILILAAIVVIYIVLGILYESLIHPITVLTTLPSAGFGALLALLWLRLEFSIMALIGVFLLIGIVKKNAILIIDFALDAQRARGLPALQAVREAALMRFRPIMMTTLAAALGALPLAVGFGIGSELRQPLGVTIIGGLIASQLLTLLTTPVVYMLLDKLRHRPAHEALLARGAAQVG